MSPQQNVGQNHKGKMANKSFQNLAKFRHLRTDTNKLKLHAVRN